jgi:site-specific DNA-cytosine methylase
MDDARSGLLRDFCAVVLDARPELFFGENTPEVVNNGSLEYLKRELEEHYDISWKTLTASSLGFKHERKRFFAVGRRRDQILVPPSRLPIVSAPRSMSYILLFSYRLARLLDSCSLPSACSRSMEYNQLSGTIPSTIGQLAKLTNLCAFLAYPSCPAFHPYHSAAVL